MRWLEITKIIGEFIAHMGRPTAVLALARNVHRRK